jgi:hypothetical protein
MVVGTPTGAIVGAFVGRGTIISARAAAAVLAGAVVSALVGLSLGLFFIESTVSMLAGASISVVPGVVVGIGVGLWSPLIGRRRPVG